MAALVILAVGIAFQLALLVYAMYVLAIVLLVSRFLARRWVESLSATRECSRQSAQIGDAAAVVITIRNSGMLPIPWVLLEDSLPNAALTQRPPRIKVEGARAKLCALRPGGQQSLLYQVRFQMRGFYQLGPLLYESGDVFGLHRRYRVETEPCYVLVYPRVVPLVGYDIASRRPVGEVRLTHRLFEDPTRISGVREYRVGDEMRRIHWGATARTGQLHSKTYEPSTLAGASLLLDFHLEGHPRQHEPTGSEFAITVAASLANALSVAGQQVGFYSNGRDAADRIREEGHRLEFRTRQSALSAAAVSSENTRLRPVTIETRRGAEQFQQILETLARLELTSGLTFAQLILEIAPRLPRDATVIAILARVSAEAAVALGNLKRRGFSVTVLLILSDESQFLDDASRLYAERVEVRRLDDEASLSSLCSQQVVGAF